MKNEEILKKAIEKVQKKGYVIKGMEMNRTLDQWRWYTDDTQYFQWIFSHDFAKAFWGEKLTKYQPEWQWQLKAMVIEEEPIKYLEKFL